MAENHIFPLEKSFSSSEISSDGESVEWRKPENRERNPHPLDEPSLRYLATEILFKGYCIIFLMRFPLSLPLHQQTYTVCNETEETGELFSPLNTFLKAD
jgi:hypothetical protein